MCHHNTIYNQVIFLHGIGYLILSSNSISASKWSWWIRRLLVTAVLNFHSNQFWSKTTWFHIWGICECAYSTLHSDCDHAAIILKPPSIIFGFLLLWGEKLTYFSQCTVQKSECCKHLFILNSGTMESYHQ